MCLHNQFSYAKQAIVRFSIGGFAVAMTGCAGSNRPVQPSSSGLHAIKDPGASQSLSSKQLARSGVLDRDSLVRAVLERNPSVESARLAWRRAVALRSQRGSLDDPMLSYSFAPLSIGSSDVRFGQVIELSQRLPWPGKLESRADVVIAEADARKADYEATRLDLALAASLLFDDFYLGHRSLEVNAEHRTLLLELKQTAEARYAVGQASLQDPLQAEVEIAHLDHEKVVFVADLGIVRAKINALLHRKSGAALLPPPKVLVLDSQRSPSTAGLRNKALAQRPEVRAANAEIRAGSSQVRFAEREYFPDLTLMGSYNSMWNRVEHQFMLGFSTNLPIQRATRRGAVEEANARVALGRSELRSTVDEIQREVEENRLRLIKSLHVVRLFNERLLPAARAQTEAARIGFETARDSFFVVLAAEKNLRTTELGRHAALAEVFRSRARLIRAVGGPTNPGERGSL